MKRILVLITGIILAVQTFAVPAHRKTFTVTQPNGVELTLQLVGDETMHYYVNVNTGEKMLRDADGNYYVMSEETVAQRTAAAKVRRSINNARRSSRKLSMAKVGSVSGSMTGSKKGLVILVNFTDKTMASGHTQSTFNNQFNQEGYTTGGHLGSVHDYFYDQSYGAFNLTFDVVGPVTVSNTMSYYGGNDSSGNDTYPAKMVIEALKLVDSQVNFADYDWDGDGEVDQVYVIYAGFGEAYGASDDTIWPHEWQLSAAKTYGDGSGAQTLDGVKIDTYACSCELSGTSGSTLNGIGTACHEFSHCLGFPDFYDTSYAGGFGMNAWDLMDAGSYNGPNGHGEVPAGYTSYERMCAGWLTPTELSNAATITNMKSLNDEAEAYIIYNDANENEFILLENRQNTKWFKYVDTYTTPHGLLALHVDYSATAWNNNEPNNTASHQRMSIIPASGTYGTKKTSDGQTYYDCSQSQLNYHPFSGSNSSKTALTSTSNSSSGGKWFTACSTGSTQLNHAVTEITNASDGTISFLFDGGAIVDDGNRYTVTLNAGTGSCSTHSWTQTEFQETTTLPSVTPTATGWTFIGWSTTEYATETTTKPTGLYAAGSTYLPTENTTLYAVFKYTSSSSSGASGSYTLDYTAESSLQSSMTTSYGNAVEYTATDGSEWVVKAYKNGGMQINKGKNASIKVPDCPGPISSIVVTDATARVLTFGDSDYTGSNTPTVIATSDESKTATFDLSGKSATTGYIYSLSASTVITKIVVNYGGGASVSYYTYPGDNGLTNPTITFASATQSLLVGDVNDTFTATVTGSTGAVSYTSSDESVATIGPSTGRVVAKGVGTTTITATVAAVDGVSNAASATYKLTVTMPALESIAVTTPPTKTTYFENESFSKEGMVVTATYANGYKDVVDVYTCEPSTSVLLTTSDTEITITYTEGGITKTTTQPITVNALPKYTVTFNAGTGTCATATLTEAENGAGVVLPSATSVSDEWAFAGWATASTEATTTRPTLYTAGATYEPTANTTLYAVYSLSETSGGSGNYERVTEDLDDWSGDYIIAYSDNIMADGRTGGTTGIGKQGSAVAPGDNLSGNTIASEWGDTYHITLEAIDGGYAMKTQDGLYNYRTSNTNGIDATEELSTASSNPITVTFNSQSDIDLASQVSGTNKPVFHYNTNNNVAAGGFFRFYASGNQSNIYLYKKEGSLRSVTYNSNPTAAALTTPTITFAITTDKAMLVGDTYTNTATATGSTGAISYSSSDTKVATVNAETGEVTAISVGNVVITAFVDAVAGVSRSATTTYNIAVTMPTLASITIKTPATTTTYEEGEAFTSAGLVITAAYANGYTADVTTGFVTTPAEGDAVALSNTTVTVSYTQGEVTKTTTYDITITELPKYAVTFVVKGVSTILTEEIANNGVTAPTVSTEGDYTFYGWSKTEVSEETTTKPSIVKLTSDGKFVPTENTTLYAIYTRQSAGVINGFILKTNDKYVGTPDSGSKKFTPVDAETSATTLFFDSGYLWYINSTGNVTYAYNSSSKADILFTTTKSNAGTWVRTENSDGTISFMNAENNRYLALNGSYFRGYADNNMVSYPHDFEVTETSETFTLDAVSFYTSYPNVYTIGKLVKLIDKAKTDTSITVDDISNAADRILEK